MTRSNPNHSSTISTCLILYADQFCFYLKGKRIVLPQPLFVSLFFQQKFVVLQSTFYKAHCDLTCIQFYDSKNWIIFSSCLQTWKHLFLHGFHSRYILNLVFVSTLDSYLQALGNIHSQFSIWSLVLIPTKRKRRE